MSKIYSKDYNNHQWFSGLHKAQGNQQENLALGSNPVVINNF